MVLRSHKRNPNIAIRKAEKNPLVERTDILAAC